MDINELAEERQKLTEKLSKLIQEFESRTGVPVAAVEITRAAHQSENYKSASYLISVEPKFVTNL